MLLNQLTISYRCHSSIGNSLDLKTMIDELLRTFMDQTEAINGSFFLINGNEEEVLSRGKDINLNTNELISLASKDHIVIKKYNEELNILLYRIQKGILFFIYDSSQELDFIITMYESLRKKIDLSIDSCLNVKELEEKNETLNELNYNLEGKIEEAIRLNKEKDRHMYEQEKVAQMGELLGNIAHQWRQPLSIISTLASGMKVKKQMDVLNDDEFFNYTDKMLSNVKLLTTTINEFSEYIDESNQYKDVVVQERVRTAVNIVSDNFTGFGIRVIEDRMEEEELPFRLVLGELLQSLIPILNNAKDALHKRHDGDKWIKYSVVKDLNSILISIEDNAGGIPEEIIDKIFNPYFTTKHKAQGTGIGLYNSYNLVTKHLDGKLFVENTSEGAKFTIQLPMNFDYVI